MLSFNNDYSEGAHPKILEALVKTNLDSTVGYGEDEFSSEAKEVIRKKIACETADIYFLVGGTQTNTIAISHTLKPYEAVIACETGHIAVHETGAIEATGHKVIVMRGKNFKLRAEDIELALERHTDHHMVNPKMVYISNSTELGTIYSKKELKAISDVCKKNNLYLYLDGARISSALTAEGTDLKLKDYAKYCDMFYLGGTKSGLLFGEALVIVNDELKKDIQFSIKQKGGLLAKGRLLGVQFLEMFKANLFEEIGSHMNEMAKKIKEAFIAKGIDLVVKSNTNQVFVYLTAEQIKKLKKKVIFAADDFSGDEIDRKGFKIARFVTSWATTIEDVKKFKDIIKKL